MRAVVLALALVCATPGMASAQSFEERLSLCLACHGEKGTSETPEVPSLGGQPSPYALIQLYMFRQKLRLSEIMNDMAKGLSDADLQKFADTIAKLPPPQPAAEGRRRPAWRAPATWSRSTAAASAMPRISPATTRFLGWRRNARTTC